ncbi:MAG: acyl-CoA dehydrogenase family protein, partial [Acidimicrobiales bacterium]|nr:acyl-CoA dehydrogenase family protein [Acidimicrobiales bacterium]
MISDIDQTTTQLLAKVAELGPGFRQRMRQQDEDSAFPVESLAEATQAGLHKLCVPTEYGGYGYWQPGNYTGFYQILEELAFWEA